MRRSILGFLSCAVSIVTFGVVIRRASAANLICYSIFEPRIRPLETNRVTDVFELNTIYCVYASASKGSWRYYALCTSSLTSTSRFFGSQASKLGFRNSDPGKLGVRSGNQTTSRSSNSLYRPKRRSSISASVEMRVRCMTR